jgi:putative ABC transport system permease protein
MLHTRFRKILRDVWARKGRTALVSVAIFIGVTGTIALFSLNDILVTQLRADIQEEELAMIQVATALNVEAAEAKIMPDDVAHLERIRQIEGLSEAQGRVNQPAYMKLNEGDEDFIDVLYNAYMEPYEALSLEPVRLLEGAFPVDGQPEVALEKRLADRFGISVGQTVYFRILSPSKETGEIGTLEPRTVTGIVLHPYNQQPRQSVFGHVADGNYITGTRGLGIIAVRFVDYATAEAKESELTNVIAEETDYLPVFVFSQDPAQNQQVQNAQTIGATMSFLAIIALLVSGFLVINVISSIVVEQKRQIGIMKSIGASRLDNFIIYAGISFMYGLIGVIPGVIVGIPLGSWASQVLGEQLNTIIEGFRVSPPSIILGIVVGLLVPPLFSLFPVFMGTRVRILEAITDLGIDAKYGAGPIARLIKILPLPVTVRQGLSNVSLKKSRVAFTVITLAIAAGAFMGIFAVFNSLTSGINTFLNSFNVEVAVFPNEPQDPEAFTQLIRQNFIDVEDALIKTIEPGFSPQVNFQGYTPPANAGGPPGIFAYSYDVTSDTPAFDVAVTAGENLNAENAATGIIFSSQLANNMGKSVGDKVVMEVPGNSVELTIVGISEYPIEQVWLAWQTMSKAAGFVAGAPQPNRYETTVAVADYTGREAGVVQAFGFDEQVAPFLTFQEGEFVSPKANEILISAAMAEQGGYAVGDTLTLTATAEGGTSGDYTIKGIFTLPPQFIQADQPADFLGLFWKDLAALENRSLEGEPIPPGYFFITNLENPTADNVDAVGDDLNEVLLANGIPAQIFNFVQLVEQISQAFVTFQVILQLVALLIALVGALGLLTTLSMSVFERQKEIGVMRSVGAGSSTVALQFLTEGLIVGLIAWLVGLPLGVLIQTALLSVTGFDETFSGAFPVTAAVIGLVGMLVITTVASLYPSLAAARRTVSDILRYQ